MRYVTPDYLASAGLSGEETYCVGLGGDLMETGAILSVPRGAEAALRPKKITFRTRRDDTPSTAPASISREQMSLMEDAEKTLDLLLQQRDMTLRAQMMLALTYSMELDPMISSGLRYAYEELDWGYTEQPQRQLSCVTPVQGGWDRKQENLIAILEDLLAISTEDAVLSERLEKTLALLKGLSPEEFRTLRDAFDRDTGDQEHLFANLLSWYYHRYYLEEPGTIFLCIRRAMTAYAATRAMGAQLLSAAGALREDDYIDLCSRLSRVMDENPVQKEKFRTQPQYSRENLERMLWQ